MLEMMKIRYQPDITMRQNAEAFWTWFASHADAYDQGFLADSIDYKCLAKEMSVALCKVSNGLGWCFGPAMDKNGHHLAFSPEGKPDFMLIAEYLVSMAPSLKRWEFYPTKPGGVGGKTLEVEGQQFHLCDIQIALTPDEEKEMPSLVAHHPLFAEMNHDTQMRILFIALDECLGESGTENQLSCIETSSSSLEHCFPMSELAEQLRRFYDVQEWIMPQIGPAWTSLTYKHPDDRLPFPRADLIAATTCHPQLSAVYHRKRGAFDDPVVIFGAAYMFAMFPINILPKGQEVSIREQIEDNLDGALRSQNAGMVFGGGSGAVNSYIDIMITAGRTSIDVLAGQLQAMQLGVPVEVMFFDQRLRRERIVVR